MDKTYKFKNNSNERLSITIELNEKSQPVFSAFGSFHFKYSDQSGQILDVIPEFIKTLDKGKGTLILLLIYRMWKKYHLNDLNAWCEHQNYKGSPRKVKLHHLVGNELYEKLSTIRELPPKYLGVTDEGLKNIPSALYNYSAWDKKHNQHIEKKSTGWTPFHPIYSPDGLLGKPCSVCGAKYGHGWYYKPITEADLKIIKRLLKGE